MGVIEPPPLRVLLVEDSNDDAELVMRELQRGIPHLVFQRVQSPEAFEHALADGSWNLIISDHQMPQFSSGEALRLLRRIELDIPFIIVSGAIGEEYAVAALKAGANDYVLKHNLARLVPAVERELREAAQRNERRATLRSLAESEELLKKSERRFQDLFEFAPDAIIMTDPHGTIVLLNQQAEVLFGYSRDQLLNLTIELLLPEYTRLKEHDSFAPLSAEGRPATPYQDKPSWKALRKDGGSFPVDVRIGAIHSGGGKLWAFAVRDVTDRLHAEAALRQSLSDKEVLLKEVHHRVKNNLQIISSLLSMQAERARDSFTRGVLEESNTRVRAMGLIHEMLQDSGRLGRVDFAAYSQALCTHLVRSYRVGGGIELKLHAVPTDMNVETAMPCALILNELVSNALKHAFKGGGGGTLSVTVQPEPEGEFSVTVRDTGPGLPDGFQLSLASSLGMQLVRSLTEQVKGRLQIHSEGGACFSLFCKELSYAGG